MLLREKIYLALAAIVIAGFVWWTIHVKNQQAIADRLADQRVADAQLITNQKIEDAVKLRIQQLEDAKPPKPLPTPHLVCSAPKTSPGSVPKTGSTTPEVDGSSGLRGTDNQTFDPAPAVQQDGRDADDQIRKLEGYIQSLKDQGVIR